MTPQSIIEAAAGHISAGETEGWQADPDDALYNWDACSLPQVPGLDRDNPHDQQVTRNLLAREIKRQLRNPVWQIRIEEQAGRIWFADSDLDFIQTVARSYPKNGLVHLRTFNEALQELESIEGRVEVYRQRTS